MARYSVTNIKFSFYSDQKIRKFSTDSAIFSVYVKSKNLIIKTEYGTFSLLAGNRNNVNCTGLDNAQKIKKAVIFFAKISNQKLYSFQKFKIDCLAIRIQLQPNLKKIFLEKTSSNFRPIDTSRFPGLILKYRDNNIKISISYFNRKGIAILTGLKDLRNLDKVITLLKNDFEF